jgi:hypothetical protein
MAASVRPNEPDNISFDIVFDELNGVNRNLCQPYDPITLITEHSRTS